ncbi:TPA: DUF2958 domain-containing protein [Yersinia enterocolitica]|uniref:DUF2958 domain-containing protein n=1 Tax=Salmonella enterica TaxID=28901 RepID=UPI003D2F0666
MPQPLTTAPERAQLLANGEARAAGRAIDPVPVVRLFTPDAHVTWLLAALDPLDGDTAWGLIDLGIGTPAQGTVKLSDLAYIVGPLKRPVPLFPPHAHAVGIHPLGRARWGYPGLNTAYCDFFSQVPYRAGLNRDSCGVAAPA